MSAQAHYRQGLESLRQGHLDAAVAQLEQALRLEPGSAEYAKALGNAYRAGGNLQAAMASYRRALRAAPDYVPALYNLAVILRELGRLDEAEATFEQVAEHPLALLGLGEVCPIDALRAMRALRSNGGTVLVAAVYWAVFLRPGDL